MAIGQSAPPRIQRSRHHARRMTEAEFLALPEEQPYLEFVDGVVTQKTMADHQHRRLVGKLDQKFGNYVDLTGGDFGPEGRVRMPPGNYQVPDTAYFAPGARSGNDSIPTVAVEVRSRDETMRAQREKCRRYRAAGVPVCWLIDPVGRTVEVFEGDLDAEPVAHDGALETAAMPGFSLTIRDLFAFLDRE